MPALIIRVPMRSWAHSVSVSYSALRTSRISIIILITNIIMEHHLRMARPSEGRWPSLLLVVPTLVVSLYSNGKWLNIYAIFSLLPALYWEHSFQEMEVESMASRRYWVIWGCGPSQDSIPHLYLLLFFHIFCSPHVLYGSAVHSFWILFSVIRKWTRPLTSTHSSHCHLTSLLFIYPALIKRNWNATISCFS